MQQLELFYSKDFESVLKRNQNLVGYYIFKINNVVLIQRPGYIWVQSKAHDRR